MLNHILSRLGISQEDEYEEDEADGQACDQIGTSAQILLTRPRSVGQLEHAVRQARSGISVILSVEDAAPEERQRILDFSSGLCAGLGLTFQQASAQIFILSAGLISGMEDSQSRDMW